MEKEHTSLDKLEEEAKELGKLLISGIKGDEYKKARKDLTTLKEVIKVGKQAYTRQDLTPLLDSALDDLERIIDSDSSIIETSEKLIESLSIIKGSAETRINDSKVFHQKLSIIRNSLVEVEDVAMVSDKVVPDPRIVRSFEEQYGRNKGRQMLRDKGYEI